MPVAILGFGPLGDFIKIEYIMIVCGLLLLGWGLCFKRAAEQAQRYRG